MISERQKKRFGPNVNFVYQVFSTQEAANLRDHQEVSKNIIDHILYYDRSCFCSTYYVQETTIIEKD